jgi:hypothetical protein
MASALSPQCNGRHRPVVLSVAAGLLLALCGCGNSEEGTVPKLPPRSEVEKNLGTPFLKEGAKVRKSQSGGMKE